MILRPKQTIISVENALKHLILPVSFQQEFDFFVVAHLTIHRKILKEDELKRIMLTDKCNDQNPYAIKSVITIYYTKELVFIIRVLKSCEV